MVATLELYLEFDDSFDDSTPPFSCQVAGLIDFRKSVNISHSKPYALLQALAGVRGDPHLLPLIAPRGLPQVMNPQLAAQLQLYYASDYPWAGWLSYPEFCACLQHQGLELKQLGPPLTFVCSLFAQLSAYYGAERVRLIFVIDSP